MSPEVSCVQRWDFGKVTGPRGCYSHQQVNPGVPSSQAKEQYWVTKQELNSKQRLLCVYSCFRCPYHLLSSACCQISGSIRFWQQSEPYSELHFQGLWVSRSFWIILKLHSPLHPCTWENCLLLSHKTSPCCQKRLGTTQLIHWQVHSWKYY